MPPRFVTDFYCDVQKAAEFRDNLPMYTGTDIPADRVAVLDVIQSACQCGFAKKGIFVIMEGIRAA